MVFALGAAPSALGLRAVGRGFLRDLARLFPLLAMALMLASNPKLRAQGVVSFTYVTNQNGITITGYSGAGEAVTIPADIHGLPVTAIGDGAFSGRIGPTQIIIPDGVTSIGYGAFWGCTGLTQITLPGSLANIGNGAFADCPNLASSDARLQLLSPDSSPIDDFEAWDTTEVAIIADQSQAAGHGGGRNLAIGQGDAVTLGFHGRTQASGALSGLGVKGQDGDAV
ncbi:MAG: leucine-rich repeat domain-containing protein [Verrucomicrobiae bacterium]|nr:leucine-rich repeat domain-containing protein [Verrucomicrobiae bacterium]